MESRCFYLHHARDSNRENQCEKNVRRRTENVRLGSVRAAEEVRTVEVLAALVEDVAAAAFSIL